MRVRVLNGEKAYKITSTRGELTILELICTFNDAAYDKHIPNKLYDFDDFEFLPIDGRPRDDEFYNLYAIYNNKNKLIRIAYVDVDDDETQL